MVHTSSGGVGGGGGDGGGGEEELLGGELTITGCGVIIGIAGCRVVLLDPLELWVSAAGGDGMVQPGDSSG